MVDVRALSTLSYGCIGFYSRLSLTEAFALELKRLPRNRCLKSRQIRARLA